jgi:hypothetical protein
MFAVKWNDLLITDEEFEALAEQIGTGYNIHINYLSHGTLDKLYVMVFPDGSMVVPRGGDYQNFGPFLAVNDVEAVLEASEFDSRKHLQHSLDWKKEQQPGSPPKRVELGMLGQMWA